MAHTYVGSPLGEQHLWSDDGATYGGEVDVIHEAHICLEAPEPTGKTATTAELDVVTGRLDGDGRRTRPVWHTPGRPEVFARCPRCDASEQISDLQTKGEEPFQQLVAVQVLAQPPRPESRAPMKGRKTLVFSDGRQTASRLAGLLKTFAFRDSVRPLLVDGMAALRDSPYRPSLDDAPLAVCLSAAVNNVRLRPVGDDTGNLSRFGHIAKDYLEDANIESEEIAGLSRDTSDKTPRSVFHNIYAVLQDRHTGLSALALATVGPKLARTDNQALEALAAPACAGLTPKEDRAAVLDLWLWCALHARAIKLSSTPPEVGTVTGPSGVALWNGRFNDGVRRALTAAGHAGWLTQFLKTGVPLLRNVFSGSTDQTFQIPARKVALVPGETVAWRRCRTCTAVSPANPLLAGICPACAGQTEVIDPAADQVFRSRKAFFRRASERLAAREPGFAPHQLIAEEHSAQLNDTSMVRAMSRNEAYELRFQDVPISQDGQACDPIDVLSCTTTMEVGIDIGGLTAVALRNVPPGRANYQQRSGRAGRRGAGLSTVLMFCGADSHDQSFFRDPAPIVAGPAPDPVLNLDNKVIAERQAYAFLLGRFQQARVIGNTNPNIFESLGLTIDFLNGDAASFSLAGLKTWLLEHRDRLTLELDNLFGKSCPGLDSADLLTRWPVLLEETLGGLHPPKPDDKPLAGDGEDDPLEADAPDNDRSGVSSAKLLDQLFALGLMPRYAFPTDVATFAVFEDNTNAYRPQLLYSPQQALNQALAQYAPGHEVWVDGKTHISMGIWSAYESERFAAYKERKLYYHCQTCDFAVLKPLDSGFVGQTIDCPACKARGGMGPAQRWLRPVGFSHPPAMPPAPPKIDGTVNSRPTRAKLEAPYFRPDLRVGGKRFESGAGWEAWCDNLDLVVTNRGTQSSQAQGFRHCPLCGRTEPTDLDASLRQLMAPDHERPRPRKPGEPDRCAGRPVQVVLGNQFRTDIAVFRLQMPPSWDLSPTRPATIISAKSAVEALVRAASQDLEPGDIDGDYRFAPGQNATTLLDLYIYDQAAGGAGFVKAAASRPERLVCAALEILDDCTCEDSCYQCLRSYKNRFDHSLLDRRLGADLLRSCFYGTEPDLPDAWAQAALRRLCDDMNDSGADYEVRSGGLVGADGKRVVLAHPFRPQEPGNARAKAIAEGPAETRVIDVLMVDRALPVATANALDKAAKTARALPQASGGAPLLTIQAILAGKSVDGAPRVAAGAHEAGDFVMNLEAHTLDGPLGDGQRPVVKGTPCLFRPLNGGPLDVKQVYLLKRTDGRAFGSTQSEWTVGTPQPLKGDAGVRVRYRAAAKRLECASEVVSPPHAVEAIAIFVRQLH
ncbi:MAG: Zn-binding domain-containing protein [Rhodopila sp.]